MGERILVRIEYDPERLTGTLTNLSDPSSSVWDRIWQSAVSKDEFTVYEGSITLSWPNILTVVREFAPLQRKHEFRFQPTANAKVEIDRFIAQYRAIQAARKTEPESLTEVEIESRLSELGFTRRKLRSFQIRDLKRLVALQNGANFSVPGAGKTTVTFALHLLMRSEGQKLVVIGPKSAFSAWIDVVGECIGEDAPHWAREPFTTLTGNSENAIQGLNSRSNRLILNYEQLLSISDQFARYLAQNAVHLVLDESHRMKGGTAVKRGLVLLNCASLPIRRDILTGTPMPQSPNDMRSQLDFLWPGTGLGIEIAGGRSPREVMSSLYVRTTKRELGLPEVTRHFVPVDMDRGQRALYAVVRNEALRDLSSFRVGSGINVLKARRSVMRLLQLSSNPVLAATAMLSDSEPVDSGIVQQVLDDGPSAKMIAVRDLARSLAQEGRKSVIWSIFVGTIDQMSYLLADLNPAVVYGAVPSGDPSDPTTREGQIARFHTDPNCMTLIANPAAVAEGINLHQVCHDAIYLDRSYNTTHYVQSIDRIHRLGLPPETETNVFVIQSTVPKGIGCIDYSVSRRLALKVRAMQQLLDDEDLHQIALDEEQSDEPIDYNTDPADLADLIEELEGRTSFSEGEAI